MFSFELDDELKALQDTAGKFAENEIRPQSRVCEKEGRVSDSILKKYHELGMSMLDLPEIGESSRSMATDTTASGMAVLMVRPTRRPR